MTVKLRLCSVLARRQSDPESDAPVLLVACRDASAVENDGVFDYCESESGSSGRPGASFVDTVETLEYAWQMLFRYSAAVVGDLQRYLSGHRLCLPYGYLCSSGIGYGVGYQVAEY